MNLLDRMSDVCIMLDRTTTSDGYGGFTENWTDGAVFNASITLDESTEAQIALAAGAKGVYTIATKKSVNLRFHDVLRRTSDNKVFRVVSDGDDKKTPKGAMNLRVVKAEEWVIPDE